MFLFTFVELFRQGESSYYSPKARRLPRSELKARQTRMRDDASWQTRVCMDLHDCSVKREQELHASRWELTGEKRSEASRAILFSLLLQSRNRYPFKTCNNSHDRSKSLVDLHQNLRQLKVLVDASWRSNACETNCNSHSLHQLASTFDR